ncbi:uncharacterized protein [Antedon mediterranea]|uniref:uncharacterized protein n=1 Tax=Antedon mediterranea TaxID=105859 RepID=UPI003AF538EA
MCIAENPKYNRNITVGGEKISVLITGLQPGVEYHVQVMASTETGAGPVSSSVSINELSDNYRNAESGNSVGTVIVIGVCIRGMLVGAVGVGIGFVIYKNMKQVLLGNKRRPDKTNVDKPDGTKLVIYSNIK